jgi:2-polyprenyl-3-methyl-5-hydroxy-6-metoxy-1,4-benzoquinol methylase
VNGFGANTSWSLMALLRADLTTRSDCHEILDDHGSDHALVAPTLRNLERINVLLSGIRRICRSTIISDAKKNRLRELTIADLGCGGGGLALWLARQCARRGIEARIIGIDHDPRVVSIARSRCAHEPSVTIVDGDATDPALLPDPVDWIVSNHFIHHLDSAMVPHVLKCAADKARCGVIINDLARNRLSLLAFYLLCRSIMPSGCTASDGIISILRSFTHAELTHAITTANLRGYVRMVRTGIGHRAVVIATSRHPCR